MKKRLVALGLLLALGATTASADIRQHYATASTKKEAKRLATADARAAALGADICFRPAYQVAECDKVEDGFRCRADSSDNARTCRRSGWLNDSYRSYLPTRTSPSWLNYTPIAGAPYETLTGGGGPSSDPFYGRNQPSPTIRMPTLTPLN